MAANVWLAPWGRHRAGPYRISSTAATGRQEVEIRLIGPGIGPSGRCIVFPNRGQANAFVEQLNIAYARGVAAGMRIN